HPGDSLVARINGVNYAVQMDVKSSNTDGSVRQAILTLDVPGIAGGGALDVMLAKGTATEPLATAPNIFAPSGSAYGFTQSLPLHNTDGTTTPHQLNAGTLLSQALQAGGVSYWMQGPLATEVRFNVPISGSFHLTFDITDFTDGTTRTDVQFNNVYA